MCECFAKGALVMEKRMTWKEIQEAYPDQWVGLTDSTLDNVPFIFSNWAVDAK